MTQSAKTTDCRKNCWIIGAAVGAVLAVLLLIVGGCGFIQSIFAGIVAAIVVGAGLIWMRCSAVPAKDAQDNRVEADLPPASAAASTPKAEPIAPSREHEEATTDIDESSQTTEISASSETTAPENATDSSIQIKPSTPLAGEADLAQRKGSWKYEADSTVSAALEGGDTTTDATSSASEMSESTADETVATSETTASDRATDDEIQIKPSTPLAGEAELAQRKGSWKYEAEPTVQAALEGADTTNSAPEMSEPTTAKTESVAGDDKPVSMLDSPRSGGADDLKLISGVGPKLEQTLNELGIWHFDQVAVWRAEEIEWVDQRLRFKGRIVRDDWVSQAKTLAEGGETEFSKRKKK